MKYNPEIHHRCHRAQFSEYSIVEIIGSASVYIDNDILEIFHDFKSKAPQKHIQLTLKDIPDVGTIVLH